MNTEYETVYCKVFYHYENVPRIFRKLMRTEFMKNRNEVAHAYNEFIDSVNDTWDLTGKSAFLGDHVEDINPEYSRLIQKRIQPHVDILNKKFKVCKYRIDEYGDITGYIPFIKNSKIWFTIKLIES